MAVSRSHKGEILAQLIEDMKGAKSIGFAQTNAMSVAEFEELRNELREVNSSYHLAKKTLIKIALKEALDLDLDLEMIPGQVGVLCSNDDAIAGLSKANDFIKKVYNKKAEVQKMTWVASVFEGQIQDMEATKEIASMPSRETLLSRLVGSMMSPLSGMARFLDAAAKEVETQGKTKLGELEAEKQETTEVVAEEETSAE